MRKYCCWLTDEDNGPSFIKEEQKLMRGRGIHKNSFIILSRLTQDYEGHGHDNGCVVTLIYPGEQLCPKTKEQGREVK